MINSYTEDDWKSESLEVKLMIVARSSTASFEECQLMDDASQEIRKLKRQLNEIYKHQSI